MVISFQNLLFTVCVKVPPWKHHLRYDRLKNCHYPWGHMAAIHMRSIRQKTPINIVTDSWNWPWSFHYQSNVLQIWYILYIAAIKRINFILILRQQYFYYFMFLSFFHFCLTTNMSPLLLQFSYCFWA